MLLDRAAKATGLSDFGDDWFMEPLRKLVEFVNRDAGLVSIEVYPVDLMVRYLSDRLKLVDYLKRHPQVCDERVEVAGVIISGRGGSTFLQRLLASSQQLTSCMGWETCTPVPLPGEGRGENAARLELGKAYAAKMMELWPEYGAIHPLEENEVHYDEELDLMGRGFISQMFPCYFHIPQYNRWELQFDQRKIYRELHLWLQLLQYQSPERRGRKWLLKTVQHMIGGGLFDLARQFPQARIIMTHRHLASVIGSWASAQAPLVRPSGSVTFRQEKLGALVMQTYRDGLEHYLRAREVLPADRFIDVPYDTLMADPLGAFRRLFTDMNLDCSREDIAAAESWIANNGRDAHPQHHYRLEDYGITRADVEREFSFYHDRFLSL